MAVSVTGVPSSAVQPSPRTWKITSVVVVPAPANRRRCSASACYWADVGYAPDAAAAGRMRITTAVRSEMRTAAT